MKKLYIASWYIFVALIFSACTKITITKSNNGANSTTGQTTAGTYYFKGTLNGQALNWQATEDVSGAYIVGGITATSPVHGINIGSIQGLFVAQNANFAPIIGVEFNGIQYDPTKDKSAYFNNFVNTGVWPYVTTLGFSLDKKITINYTDSAGNIYSSIGPQSGNGVSIISVTQVPARTGISECLKVKVTFSCTLYPFGGTGATLSLTNAEAVVRLEDAL